MKIRLGRIKITVLLLFIVLNLAFYFLNPVTSERVSASSSGPPTGRTGAPGESTCTSCHNANTTTGQFNITVPSNYVPGQTYNFQVQHTTTDMSRLIWGFEMVALTSGGVNTGTFTNTTTNTRIRSANGRNYIEQSGTGNFAGQTAIATWTFTWTAPATDIGPVSIYAAALQGDNDGGTEGDQTYTQSAVIQPGAAVVIHHGFSDFDGDGKADVSVFRPSTGIWYLNRSASGFAGIQWGIATDKLTPADFDGDDKTDFAVWRSGPATVAAFYILQSSTNTVRIETFGQTGDLPIAVGDWDGDGKADPAVYRDSAIGSQNIFFYKGSLNNPSGSVTYVPWGTTGDMPMRGDFDGDGKQDAAIFRPANAVWYILQSSNGQLRTDSWGLASDKFVNADYDGDGKADLGVFRNGTWYIKQSSNGQPIYINWGISSDVLAPADYDGDGKTDAAVYRNGTWYIRSTGSGTMSVQQFGTSTDAAVPASFIQ